VAEAADDRARLPYDRIGNNCGRVGEELVTVADQFGSLDGEIARSRADREMSVGFAQVREVGDRIDVHQNRGAS